MPQTDTPFFSPIEVERYARQLILPEIGGAGQQKLKKARLLMVGVGGLGSGALPYLAAAGIGTIGLVDEDRVTRSNLHRQIIHDTDSLGQKKIDSAEQRLLKINPHIHIEKYDCFLSPENSTEILNAYDILLDGCDNFAAHYLLADQAALCQKPLIAAALQRFSGMLTLLMPYKENMPSYRDLFPQPAPSTHSPPCSEAGIIGALPGIIGSLQAMEAIKFIAQIGEPLLGRLLVYNGLKAEFKIFHYKKPCA